jgi:hypothetical protein
MIRGLIRIRWGELTVRPAQRISERGFIRIEEKQDEAAVNKNSVSLLENTRF